MSQEDFFRISGKRDLRGLRHSDARLRLYDGSIMKPLGRYTVEVRRGLTKCQLEFEIVHSSQKPLFSVTSCQEMGLVTIHSVVDTTPPLIDRYADAFQGIGCFDGKYHMTMDTSV